MIFFLSYEAYMIMVLHQLYSSDRFTLVSAGVKLLCAVVTGVALIAIIIMSK